MMAIYSPEPWPDYELIDCGGFEKLERFGPYILIRPEPQAVWDKTLEEAEWTSRHHIRFKGRTATSGEWVKKSANIPDRWTIRYSRNGLEFSLRLGLTSFKHLGVFPEQAVNWDYIYHTLKLFGSTESVPPGARAEEKSDEPRSERAEKKSHEPRSARAEEKSPGREAPRFLNLFAYTGAASLAAKAAGADVTHLDSIKQVLNWASDNQALSGLKDIRWVLEDALKFVKREVKRGKLYHGILLDPPAYGNGPNGEKWKLEDQIQEMLHEVVQLLHPDRHFLLINTYSLGFSPMIVENALNRAYHEKGKVGVGELYLQASSGVRLPLGVLGRIERF